jgi:pimeloyl-ACP methyl ester carboxylesterase
MNSAFTTSDGITLTYTDEGQGKPVLCLAGLTRTGQDFDYVAPHLKGIRLICMDYRGRGASGWADPSTYTVPVEARDALELLDHLGLAKAAILGTSRGGLIAMLLAAMAPERLTGVALNDIGPEIAPEGLEIIKSYIGRRPGQQTYAEATEARPALMTGFANVPMSRWEDEVRLHFRQEADGLHLTYDPKLRDAVLEVGAQPAPDLWPLFDAMAGLPLALIHGENSDLLADSTVTEMQRRRPDMIYARVPDRAHIPFLDEPESLAALAQWIGALK